MQIIMFTSIAYKREKNNNNKRISFSWSFQFQQENIAIAPTTM